jgi:hypothetical protein
MTFCHSPEKNHHGLAAETTSANLPAIITLLAAATAAKSTVRFRTGFVDVQRSTIQLPAVQFGDRAIRVRIGAHLHKSEPSCLTSIAIRNDTNALNGTIRLEQRPYRIFGSAEAEVSHKYVFHSFPLVYKLWIGAGSDEGGQNRTDAKMPNT